MTYPFSVASNVKARGKEIAQKYKTFQKLQNLEIMKHVFMLSIEEFLRVCLRLHTCF